MTWINDRICRPIVSPPGVWKTTQKGAKPSNGARTEGNTMSAIKQDCNIIKNQREKNEPSTCHRWEVKPPPCWSRCLFIAGISAHQRQTERNVSPSTRASIVGIVIIAVTLWVNVSLLKAIRTPGHCRRRIRKKVVVLMHFSYFGANFCHHQTHRGRPR